MSQAIDMTIPMWLAKLIAWCGLILMVFALLDAGLGFFGIHITGTKWAPVPSLLGGFVLRWFGEALDEE